MLKTEKFWKIFTNFPQGVTAKTLAKKLNVGKTTVYELLNELRERDQACNEKGLWFPRQEKETAPSSSLVISDVVLKEIESIKEDYVNHQTDKAYRRILVLGRADNSLPKAWIVEMKDKFTRLAEEEAAIKANHIEGINPDRLRRISGYKTVIVSAALKHWILTRDSTAISINP